MPSDGFCPKCGAVMYNGACSSCGYGGRFSGQSMQRRQSTSRGSNPRIWIVVAIVLVISILVPLIFIGFVFSQVTESVEDFISVSPETGYDYEGDEWYERWGDGELEEEYPGEDGYFDGDDYIYEDDYYYDEYVPSPSDEYYESFVSSTARGLSYDIAWSDYYLCADDENITACFGAYYPVVIDSEASFVEEVNEAIRDKALAFQPKTLSGDDYLYVDCYVTYMAEDILSVLFDVWGYQDGENIYELAALNFDMTNGEVIPAEEILPEVVLMSDYRELCEYQNGYSSVVILEDMTDDEILAAITNPETGVVFYSPVGIDAGFNYPEGWMTVTLKFRTY